MLRLNCFTESDLHDPSRRPAVEEYIRFLRSFFDGHEEARYWQACLDGDKTAAAEALCRLQAKPFPKTPAEEKHWEEQRWQDPEYRTSVARSIQRSKRTSPWMVVWLQAKLDGNESEAKRIVARREVFAVQRLLNNTPARDKRGRKILEAWKRIALAWATQ